MEKFIARMIKESADVSIEQGQEKYKSYFVNISLYEKYRATVNDILIQDGYANIILE